MSTTTDMEIRFPNGRVVASKVMPDGSLKVTIEAQMQAEIEKAQNKKTFVLVKASKLSLNSFIMQRMPKSEPEQKFLIQLTEVIKNKPEDFYCPICDPTFTMSNEIMYSPETDCPWTGNSYIWWKEKARKFAPERLSRLGTKSEYIAFLGTLINDLVNKGWSLEDAWHTVCCNSQLFEKSLKVTSSKEILGFYNLMGAPKLLEPDEKEKPCDYYYLAGLGTLSNIQLSINYINHDAWIDNTVGWIILEK